MSRSVEVVRTYLELRDPSAFRPSGAEAADVEFTRCAPCPAQRYRELYDAVGEAWHWRDRAAWPDERLAQHLERPEVAVWVMSVAGETAGYFELERHGHGDVEIVYFGLVRDFMGRGLGGVMLTRAVREAWRFAAEDARVWLHTCTLDAPAALPNYRARGFEPFRQERYVVDLPG